MIWIMEHSLNNLSVLISTTTNLQLSGFREYTSDPSQSVFVYLSRTRTKVFFWYSIPYGDHSSLFSFFHVVFYYAIFVSWENKIVFFFHKKFHYIFLDWLITVPKTCGNNHQQTLVMLVADGSHQHWLKTIIYMTGRGWNFIKLLRSTKTLFHFIYMY